MLKKFTILSFILFIVSHQIKAQDNTAANFENQLNLLRNKIQTQQKLIHKNAETLRLQDDKIVELNNQLSTLKNAQSEQLTSFESKISGILGDYNTKIDDQNKVIEDLKASLSKKDFNLYLYIAIALCVALVLFVYFMKMATQKAITQQSKNWSDFLTYIVKR